MMAGQVTARAALLRFSPRNDLLDYNLGRFWATVIVLTICENDTSNNQPFYFLTFKRQCLIALQVHMEVPNTNLIPTLEQLRDGPAAQTPLDALA